MGKFPCQRLSIINLFRRMVKGEGESIPLLFDLIESMKVLSLTKSTLPNKSISTHYIGVDLIWLCHAIMLCQRNRISVFACFLMGNDRCIHLSLVESRRQ